MRIHFSLLAAVSALGVLCACGVPGVPQPPSLNLPQPVSDLSATRKGDKVTLTWAPPRETTDQETVRRLGVTRICRTLVPEPPQPTSQIACDHSIAEVKPGQVSPSGKTEFTDALPKELQEANPKGFAVYAVTVENDRGRSAGPSNKATVPAAPTSAPPSDFNATVTADGVLLQFTASSAGSTYRVYRRIKGTDSDTLIGQVRVDGAQGLSARLVDRNIEWEKTYLYHVTPVTFVPVRKYLQSSGGPTPQGTYNMDLKDMVEYAVVEGDDSPSVEVFVHDIFPPAPPTGLQAVFSPVQGQAGFIDLTWRPNTESDLAGYNVYRHEEGAAPVKINADLVKTPAFRDDHVEAGKTYSYSVTAVDLRGNESGKSVETSESAPRD